MKVLRVAAPILLLVGAILLWWSGERPEFAAAIAVLAVVAAGAGLKGVIPTKVGPAGLPDGATIKAYRRKHPEASVSDAVEALSR